MNQAADPRVLELHDETVAAEHRAAVLRGEDRFLRLTRTGELHSYLADEIGLPARGSGREVTSWWGLTILTVLFAVLFVGSWTIILLPLATGESPAWIGLLPAALGAGMGLFTGSLARMQFRARRVRISRGVPEPSDAIVPDRWNDREASLALLARTKPPHPRAHRWRKRPVWWVVVRGALSGAMVLSLVGLLTEPPASDAGTGIGVAVTGLLLTIALPIVQAVRRVRRHGAPEQV